ncbi:AbrB family transcriptional regulator [Lactobacillus amylovorus]|nr:AbrB family transcriptional regulator [Lactobacillus amylovorus]
MMEKESIKNEVQLFKSGNSWSFRVTSKDRKELNATKDTMFEKIVDPDKKEIIFKRMDAVDPDLEDFMHDFYNEHDELMRRLEES